MDKGSSPTPGVRLRCIKRINIEIRPPRANLTQSTGSFFRVNSDWVVSAEALLLPGLNLLLILFRVRKLVNRSHISRNSENNLLRIG